MKADEALMRGNEIKERTLQNVFGSPKIRGLFGRTDVLAMPDQFMDELAQKDDMDYELLGRTPKQPFVGQPYSKPFVYLRDKPIIPKLKFGNVRSFGNAGYVTPEEVLPHEMGHIWSQIVSPKFHSGFLSLLFTMLLEKRKGKNEYENRTYNKKTN